MQLKNNFEPERSCWAIRSSIMSAFTSVLSAKAMVDTNMPDKLVLEKLKFARSDIDDSIMEISRRISKKENEECPMTN